MIEQLQSLPEGVVGFAVRDELAAEDYREVLSPALERAAEAGPIRCVLVVEEFRGMTGGAMVDDLKLGLQHLRGWKRLAVVTDLAWMSNMTSLFGWMIPGETKVFPLAEREAAIAWAAASGPQKAAG
ncbi:hypothetical protein ABH931_004655 [Streptacidiphilus sp. MAP12-33]|uniref:STAS/SEC14 domain-containing protein n=1 Tax=Streptacidiphilus sp. MAP12-33 TaxID=3156266 RepID=UPI0035198D7A